jgi:hypothetical protein
MIWWIIIAVLIVALGGGVFFAARSPTFIAGLVSLATTAAWKAFMPRIFKRKSMEEEVEWRQTVSEGQRHDTNIHGPKPINRKPTGKVTIKANK